MDFGVSLKKHRKNKGMTLAQIAESTELSVSYLSKLENNASTPTLANMQKLCEVLQISMVELLDEQPQIFQRLVKSGEGKEIFSTRSGVLYRMLFDNSPKAKAISMTIDEENFGEELSWGHHYDEIGIVTEGVLEITIADEKYEIHPGDLFVIKAHEYHKYRKLGAGRCQSFWFYI